VATDGDHLVKYIAHEPKQNDRAEPSEPQDIQRAKKGKQVNTMSRPEVYKHLADSYTHRNRFLAGTERLYGLVVDSAWVIQVKPQEYSYQNVRKYFRHIYCSVGQARLAQKRLEKEYGVEAKIVEIMANELEVV
jgi:hypothetical protein